MKGFTLLELLISLSIFTLVGLATVRQIQQIQNTKESAFESIDEFNDARAALNLMRSDLSQAFHMLLDDLGAQTKTSVTRGEAVAHTIFDGRRKELVFTSLSHRNYYANRRESEQTEISYFLYTHPGKKLPSLMKRESEFIDEKPFDGGPLYRLLDNVQELEFSYYDEKMDRWVSDWNSDGGNYLDKFPQAVKIKLTIATDPKKPLQLESIFKIAFPNNTPHLVQF